MHQWLSKYKVRSLFYVGLIGIIGIVYWYVKQPAPAEIETRVPKQVAVEQLISIPISIDTKGRTINAAEIYLTFDPSLIKIESVSKEGSFFQLWIKDEPRFSNEKGEVSFAGGLPTPGFKGKGQVGLVTLRLLEAQETKLTFESKTRILLNDGLGTAIPLNLEPIVIRPK